MRFPIDVLYVNGNGRVVRLERAMPPWRIGPFVRGCRQVVELPPGTIDRTGTAVGDSILLE